MNNFYLGFKFALSYFTILPVRFKDGVDLSTKEILGNFIFTLPLVGLIIGTISVLSYTFFLDSIPILGALISAGFYMILYGFLHTEAIADVADAIYAKHSGKDAYEVIKEPIIGAMGLLYTIVLVLIKLSAIVYMFTNNLLFEFLSIVILSRVCVQYLLVSFDFKSSFVTQLKDSFSTKQFLVSLVLASIVIFLLTKISFLYFVLIALVLSFLIAKFIKKSIDFLNGDALGTTLELVEIILFIMVCYIWL